MSDGRIRPSSFFSISCSSPSYFITFYLPSPNLFYYFLASLLLSRGSKIPSYPFSFPFKVTKNVEIIYYCIHVYPPGSPVQQNRISMNIIHLYFFLYRIPRITMFGQCLGSRQGTFMWSSSFPK